MRNKNFFNKLDREPQSYWLGFFCADGGFHPKLKQFGFQLAAKDHTHLDKLARIFSLNIKDGSTFDVRTQKTYHWSKLMIYCKKMVSTMMAHGIPANKTKELDGSIFDVLPERTLHHFVRGYFDGDGCISKVGIAEYRIVILGTYDFLDRMRTFINDRIPVDFTRPMKRGSGVYGIAICGTDRINVFKDWMYNESKICLERKRDIFEVVPKHRGASKHKGVYYIKARDIWIARVYENKKMRTIGKFKEEESAAVRLREYRALKAEAS